MFSKLALFAAASMVIFVAAAPQGGGGISNSCNTGSIQCCNQIFESSSSESDFLKGIFNIPTGPTTGQVGASCSGTTVGGTSGNSCSSQPVCCNGNNFSGSGGGVVFGCSPINING